MSTPAVFPEQQQQQLQQRESQPQPPLQPQQNDSNTATATPGAAPSGATAAVLLPSEPVPEGVKSVQGIDFDKYTTTDSDGNKVHRDITVKEMIEGMGTMGFQATNVAEAVRIINDMVRYLVHFSCSIAHFLWSLFSVCTFVCRHHMKNARSSIRSTRI